MNAEFQYLDFQIPVFFDWPDGVQFKVITKGRRTGITKGGSNACIEILLDGEGPILWADTINANIDKYFQRYFEPELKANKIQYQWESQKKQLSIAGGYIDFRSADNPENWEGFGYKYIFLNEAGIILKNKDLYVNTVLPMLLDFPDSKLIAAGVPKGKLLRDGTEHPFYTLAKRAEEGNPKYERVTLTSYDNPLLSPDDIKNLEDEIAAIGSQGAVDQEIYGIFIEQDAINPFAEHYDPDIHESILAQYFPDRTLYISIDFNLNPFAVTFWHYWQNEKGHHFHGVDEAEIKNGNIPAMIELLKSRYGHHLHNCIITGDAMGNHANMARRDNSSHYQTISRELGLSRSQIQVPANPTHINSRSDVNWVLYESKKPEAERKIWFYINPRTMPNTCRDFRMVQCDATGTIIKRNRNDINQRADYLDTSRSLLHLAARPIILRLKR